MKISMRDKKILLMFLGILFFAAGYFLGYRPQMEEAQSIEAANAPLQERLDNLLEMAKNRDFYIEETNAIQTKIDEYTAKFPSDVKEEDGIVLAMNMEDTLDMKISNIGLGTREFVASMDGSSQDEIVDMPDQTMSEQANAQTQEQIDEIEGTDTQGQKELQNATEEAVDNLNTQSSNPVLYRTQDTIQFTSTYQSLKDVVEYLAGRTGRMTIDNINASFDSSTGNLTGSLTINMFSMAGAGGTYSEPDAGVVPYGTDNIFGTVEVPVNTPAPTPSPTPEPEQAQS